MGLHQHKNEDSVDRVAGTTQFTSSQGSKHPNEGETASSVCLGMQETSEKKEYEKGKHLRKNIKPMKDVPFVQRCIHDLFQSGQTSRHTVC